MATRAQQRGQAGNQFASDAPPRRVAKAVVVFQPLQYPREKLVRRRRQFGDAPSDFLIGAQRAQFLQRGQQVERRTGVGLGQQRGALVRLECLAVACAELLSDRFAVGCRERRQLDLAWLVGATAQFFQRRAVERGEDDAGVVRQFLRQPVQSGGMRRGIEVVDGVEQDHDALARAGLPQKIRERDTEFFGVVGDVGGDVGAARLQSVAEPPQRAAHVGRARTRTDEMADEKG